MITQYYPSSPIITAYYAANFECGTKLSCFTIARQFNFGLIRKMIFFLKVDDPNRDSEWWL